ncbi:MAG: lipoyl synthase, partial [Candidatus Omnitrophica bacterium]|nr:lipoyl synthase [Candidatus Omnitrophota bacterium]
PSSTLYPVKEFVSLERFERYKEIALSLGFSCVSSAPLVRSSYKAKLLYQEAKRCMN